VEVKMSTRYILNTLSLVAGVFLVVASRVYTGGTLEWLGFGVSAGVLLFGVVGLTLAEQRRHVVGYGFLSAVAAWSAVAALVFSGSTLGWLVFADAIAVAAIALGAAALHEVTTERVVHTLDIREGAGELQHA
jgi:hypothetical protein